MPYTKEQYEEKLRLIEIGMEMWHNMLMSLRSEALEALYDTYQWKNAYNKYREYEKQRMELRREGYCDFDVYTNNERQLSNRIDGSIVRREAAHFNFIYPMT